MCVPQHLHDFRSKNVIIKQLLMSDSDNPKDALKIATEESEILSIVLENDEEGYHLNPDFDKEDW
jgi:hypothetical protein